MEKYIKERLINVGILLFATTRVSSERETLAPPSTK